MIIQLGMMLLHCALSLRMDPATRTFTDMQDNLRKVKAQLISSINESNVQVKPAYVQVEPDGEFTISINTFKRHDCLKHTLENFQRCKPGELRVVWSEPAKECPEWLLQLERNRQITIDRFNTTNLTNRFMPQPFKFNAVFSVDDDIEYSCQAIQGALRVFRQDERRIVGFAPRKLQLSDPSGTPDGPKGFERSAHPNTVLVTKGAFLPKNLFQSYFESMYDGLREKVNHFVTGEDILMSFVYAKSTGLPAIPVMAPGKIEQHPGWCQKGYSLGKRTTKNRFSVMQSIQDTLVNVTLSAETKFINVLNGKIDNFKYSSVA